MVLANRTRKARRTSRRRTQKGAGFWNWIRGRSSAAVSPTPIPRSVTAQPVRRRTVRNVLCRILPGVRCSETQGTVAPMTNIQTVMPTSPSVPVNLARLPSESYEEGMNRLLVFFYNKLGDVEPIPTTMGDPPQALYGVHLTEEQREILRQRIRPYYEERAPFETIAEEVFHTTLEELNQEITETEGILGRESRLILYKQEGISLVPYRKAESYAGTFGRALNVMTETSHFLNYIADDERFKSTCDLWYLSMVDSYTQLQPVQTLEDPNQCILIFTDDTKLEQFGRFIFSVPERLTKSEIFSFIIANMKKLKIPFVYLLPGLLQYTAHRFAVPLSKLSQAQIYKDAIAQHKIFSIEPHLANTIQRERPDLYDTQLNVMLLNPTRWPYEQPWRLLIENIMVLDTSIVSGGYKTVLQSNMEASPLIRRALKEGKFYVADPVSIYWLRKNLEGYWKLNFGAAAKTNMRVYNYLTDVQQLVISFVQVLWYLRSVKGLGRQINVLKEKGHCFTDDIGREDVFRELIRPFLNPAAREWELLREAQKRVPFHKEEEIIDNLDQLQLLLQFFNQKIFYSKIFINTLTPNKKNIYKYNLERTIGLQREASEPVRMNIVNALNYARGIRKPASTIRSQLPQENYFSESLGKNVLTLPNNNANRRMRVARMQQPPHLLKPMLPRLSIENENKNGNISSGAPKQWGLGRRTRKRRALKDKTRVQ